jgi:hypothetical protein
MVVIFIQRSDGDCDGDDGVGVLRCFFNSSILVQKQGCELLGAGLICVLECVNMQVTITALMVGLPALQATY